MCHCTPTHTRQPSRRLAGPTNRPPGSVYVRNLEERVKPEPLKQALRAVFSEYGNVIDIVAKTNLKAKGQAFVVFDKPESALAAIEEVQGFELFEKPMQVALARTRSDATVMLHGTEEEFDAHKRRRMAEKGTFYLSFPHRLSPQVVAR
jgi:RNA recognition motif-containing protein